MPRDIIRFMFQAIVFVLAILCMFFSMPPVYGQEARFTPLQRFIMMAEHTDNESQCLASVDQYLQSQIDDAAAFNKSSGIPKFLAFFWGAQGPDAEEKRAAQNMREICAMSTKQVQILAQDYEREGGNGEADIEKQTAVRLYYYLYFARDDYDSLYRLKELGENVVTDPPSQKDLQEMKVKYEFQKENLKRSEESLEESKDFLMKRNRAFPFHPE